MDGSAGVQRQEGEESDPFPQSDVGAGGGGGRFIRTRPHTTSTALFSIPSLSSFPDAYTPLDVGDVAPPPPLSSIEKGGLSSSSHLSVSGGGGGEAGGGRGEHLHTSYEMPHHTQGGEGGRDVTLASFDMFQKTQGAGTNQLFRFDSGGSNGSFVRTFYLDPSPHTLLEHPTAHNTHMDQHTLSHSHHDHTHHDHAPSHDVALSAGHRESHTLPHHSHTEHKSTQHDNRGDAFSLEESRTMMSEHPHNSSDMSAPPPSSSSSSSGQVLLHHSHSLPSSSLLPVASSPSSSSSSSLSLSTAIGSGCGHQYVDITEYLNMPQYVAARKLGIGLIFHLGNVMEIIRFLCNFLIFVKFF